MFILEDFQRNAVNAIAARFALAKRVLLQSATGSGKTVMAVEFVREWLLANPGKNVVCLFNLTCLLPQFEESFRHHRMRDEIAVFHDTISRAKDGTMLVNHQDDSSRRIMLTLHDTLAGNMFDGGCVDLKLDEEWLSNVGLVLIDEAHKGTSNNYQRIRDYFDCQVLGLTATPARSQNDKGECLANDWEYELVTTLSIQELIDLGKLVKPHYHPVEDNGDVWGALQAVYAQHSVTDGNRQTLWVCRDTKEAKEWEKSLREGGESVERVTGVDDADTTKQTAIQREAMFKRFETGETTHLVSVNALCEGFDSPIAKYVVVDRGITHRSLWQQIVGRVLRTHKASGKLSGHVIDRGGNIDKHGMVEHYEWSLEAEDAQVGPTVNMGEKVTISQERYEKAKIVKIKCETQGCISVYNAKQSVTCPSCGTAHSRKVTAQTGAVLSYLLPRFQPSQYSNAIKQVQLAVVNGDIAALTRVMNYLDDFLNEDGGLNTKYAPLLRMNPKNLKGEVELDMLAA